MTDAANAAPTRGLAFVLAAIGVLLAAVVAWHMYFPGTLREQRVQGEIAAALARRAAPTGAEVELTSYGQMSVLAVDGVTERRDQDAVILLLARAQMQEEWRPIRIEFRDEQGELGDRARVVTLREGELLD